MKNIYFVTLLMIGCGSDPNPGPIREPANPCATPGSTYYQSCVEEDGTCGPMTDHIVNINSDGTFTSEESISCAEVTQNGCTARDTDCKFSTNGVSVNETFETVFTKDGSSATALISIAAHGSDQACVSTYRCTFTRQ